MISSLLFKLINFALLWVGGCVGRSKNKDQLSPAKNETRTELGKKPNKGDKTRNVKNIEQVQFNTSSTVAALQKG